MNRDNSGTMMMKAYVLHGINDLRFEDVPVPVPGKGEALVEVQAAGICGSDIPRIYKTGAHTHPLIPGHEFSGVVRAVGEGVDSERYLGRHVGIFPLIPCRKCEPCQKHLYEMCRNYSYLGSRQDGGFAEYCVVPVWNLIVLPAEVSFIKAAMMEPMAVAVHAMRGIGLGTENGAERWSDAGMIAAERKQDMRIGVFGLGTIGLLLTMFLREAGYENVYVFGNKEAQKRRAYGLGVTCFCDTRKENPDHWIDAETNGNGLDVFFDCIGKNEVVEFGINHAAPAGRLMMVGNPYGDVSLSKDTYWKILRHELTVRGTWNSGYTADAVDDWHYVLTRLVNGTIHPEQFITHCFALPDLVHGFELMRDKTEDYVKIMYVRGE